MSVNISFDTIVKRERCNYSLEEQEIMTLRKKIVIHELKLLELHRPKR